MKRNLKDQHLLEDLYISSDNLDIPEEEVPPVEEEFIPKKTQSSFMRRKRHYILTLLGGK